MYVYNTVVYTVFYKHLRWRVTVHPHILLTVFLLKNRHLLFFNTMSLKCVLNPRISTSALVLRHSKPTARCKKSCTSWKRAVDAFSFKTHARHHTFSYSAFLVLLPQLLPNIGQANLKSFILRQFFRRNTVMIFNTAMNTL